MEHAAAHMVEKTMEAIRAENAELFEKIEIAASGGRFKIDLAVISSEVERMLVYYGYFVKSVTIANVSKVNISW